MAVQIDHIAVRNAPLCPVIAEHLERRAPRKGFVAHESVIFSVKIFDEVIREIERELSGRRSLQDGAHGLIEDTGIVVDHFVARPAFLGSEIVDGCQEIRVPVAKLCGK